MSKSPLETQLQVEVKSLCDQEYSSITDSLFLYAYTVTIKNSGSNQCYLSEVKWKIIDGDGAEMVKNDASVKVGSHGLMPGESFVFTESIPLTTDFATMDGTLQFVQEDGSTVNISVPRHYLAASQTQFDGHLFERGEIIFHNKFKYHGLIVDYDLHFKGDEDWYNGTSKPPKYRPWYHVLVNGTGTITYVAERNVNSNTDAVEFRHPLLDFFFKGKDGEKYIRNEATWNDLISGPKESDGL